MKFSQTMPLRQKIAEEYVISKRTLLKVQKAGKRQNSRLGVFADQNTIIG